MDRMRDLIRIVEGAVPPGYWRDNPGGDWLADHREEAEWGATKYRNPVAQKLLRGRTTAKVAGVMLPTEWLRTIPGAKDEVRSPGEAGFDRLSSTVDAEGWSAEKADTVVLAVNQRGEPFIYEGNTRIAVAHSRAIPALRVEVQWVNGGEDLDGPASPARIAALAQRVGVSEGAGSDPQPDDDLPDEDAFIAGPDGSMDDVEVDRIFGKPFAKVLADAEAHDAHEKERSYKLLEPDGSADTASFVAPGYTFKGIQGGVLLYAPDGSLAGGFIDADVSISDPHQGRGLGAELVAERYLRHGDFPTWYHDTPGYTPQGIASFRSARRLLRDPKFVAAKRSVVESR